MITHRPYAPVLSKSIVEGNEDFIRQTIMNGVPGRMPGFKYGLSAADISDIVDYLGTLEKPFEASLPKKGAAGSTKATAPNTESNANE